MSEHLLDDDGENRAVRAFLMMYGEPGFTVGAMRFHMEMCGFPHWPEWVTEGSTSHLTKAGAQLWLRHLFALEDVKHTSKPFASIRVTIGAHQAEVEITSDQLVNRRWTREYMEIRASGAIIKCVRDAQAAGTI